MAQLLKSRMDDDDDEEDDEKDGANSKRQPMSQSSIHNVSRMDEDEH